MGVGIRTDSGQVLTFRGVSGVPSFCIFLFFEVPERMLEKQSIK